MPDLRPTERFSREMARLERSYVTAIRGKMATSRLALVDMLVRNGVASPWLPQTVRQEMDALRQHTGQTAREHTAQIEEAAARLAKAQLDGLRRFEKATPDFQNVVQPTGSERLDILAGFVANASNWVDTLQGRLLGEIARLKASHETDEMAMARLLAEEIRDRASVWRTGSNTMTLESLLGLWSTTSATTSSYYRAGESQAEQQWSKQAIAAIDQNTTDCCLRVHGQIQRLNKPFKLTGTPRFADEIQDPPFHDACRTAETLYIEAMEAVGVTTAEMRDAARAELEARARTGRRQVIWPAHATSRRN